MVPSNRNDLLQHHAELRAVARQAHRAQVHAVHQHRARVRVMERRHQARDGGLARAGRPHQRRHRAGRRREAHRFEHRLAGLVGERDVVEHHVAADALEAHRAPRVLVFRPLAQDFARALQAGERFRYLRADAHHLEHRRHQERQEHGERHEAADGEIAGQDLPRADEHHHRAHHPHQHGGAKAHQRDRGERPQDVLQQPLHPARKHGPLALLGVVALHHAHAAQRFGQPPRHLRHDLAALAEDRPDDSERLAQREGEARRW